MTAVAETGHRYFSVPDVRCTSEPVSHRKVEWMTTIAVMTTAAERLLSYAANWHSRPTAELRTARIIARKLTVENLRTAAPSRAPRPRRGGGARGWSERAAIWRHRGSDCT